LYYNALFSDPVQADDGYARVNIVWKKYQVFSPAAEVFL